MLGEPKYDEDTVTLGYLNTRLDGTTKLVLRKSQNHGSQPVPPYRVNDTYMNGIDIYICKTERLFGDFNSNDWGKASNYTDNQLAESKNKVFNTQPVPPYKIGDLWTGGPNGELRRCVFTRATGLYKESDWENATNYTSDNSLHVFLNNTYSGDVSSLQEQLDGKIETYYIDTDPNTWAVADRAKHQGDMWYSATAKQLKRYSGVSNVWNLIEDKNAIEAYEKASLAKDTADTKRRIFVSEPIPPYDIGDLWTTGVELYRCKTSKENGLFEEIDWESATTYDNTQTTVEGGLVTTGTIQVVQGGTVAAGMTGNSSGNNAIRFWAGSTLANRANAPFKVTQGGAMTANSGSIGGWTINENGLTNGKVFIRKDGYTTIYTAADIFIIKAIMYGESWAAVTPGTAEFNRYDLNGDGEINSQDLFILRQMLLD